MNIIPGMNTGCYGVFRYLFPRKSPNRSWMSAFAAALLLIEPHVVVIGPTLNDARALRVGLEALEGKVNAGHSPCRTSQQMSDGCGI
jgi:hypothetical protein